MHIRCVSGKCSPWNTEQVSLLPIRIMSGDEVARSQSRKQAFIRNISALGRLAPVETIEVRCRGLKERIA